MTRLGVNIDHVATIRQARAGRDPEPVAAALLAQSAGAHGITVHLRGDRRHIQERDIRLLKEVLAVPLTVRCVPSPDLFDTLASLKPAWVTLVPETREELTTLGGLDAVLLQTHLRPIIRDLRAADIRVCLFIEPSSEQVKMANRLEADAVEFDAGSCKALPWGGVPAAELEELRKAAGLAARLGLKPMAAQGLNRTNIKLVATIAELEELTVGHSIVSRAVLVGMEQAVREMLSAITEASE